MTWTPTIHERSAWEDPKLPVTGGSPFPFTALDTIVPHYTADDNLIDGDPGEHANQLDDYLRAIQASYERTRGYSIGYSFAIDWLGGIWELRGFDWRPAANLDHNHHTLPVLFLVDGADHATAEAWQTFRWLNAHARSRPERRRTTKLFVIGHGQLQKPNHPTGCPGIGIRLDIAAGLGDDEYEPPKPPKPEPPKPTPEPPLPPDTGEDDDMATNLHLVAPADAGLPEVIVTIDGAGATIIGLASPADAAAISAAMKATRVEVSAEQFNEFNKVARVGDGA